jgi:hypothetical protein
VKYVFLVALLLSAAPARAQPKAAAPPKPAVTPAAPKPEEAPKAATRTDKTGQKVMRFSDGVVIEGKIHKPNTFYVLQRSTINYDWETLREGFVPKILDSVKRAPF